MEVKVGAIEISKKKKKSIKRWVPQQGLFKQVHQGIVDVFFWKVIIFPPDIGGKMARNLILVW